MYHDVRNDAGLLVGVTDADGGFIPANGANADYQNFLGWHAIQEPPSFSLDPSLPATMLPLVAELAANAYAGLTDQQTADVLNARTQRGNVPLWEIDLYRVRNGLTIPLEKAKSSHPSVAVRNAAAAALAYLGSPHVMNIDLDDHDGAAMLLALEEGEVITAEQLQAIDSLADNRSTRCEQLGLPPVSAAIVALARSYPPPED